MKVGIIGSGGREHAICHALNKSNKVDKIYCFPGNAGTGKIALNISIDLENFNALKEFIISEKIDLVVIGPEKPLVDGIVDFLQKSKIKVFGPNQIAAQLEGSKIFTKNLCKQYKIPTAKFGIFTNKEKAFIFIENSNYPLVIKADGLASGKGVYICEEKNKAKEAINEIFDGKFGVAKNLLVEEFLDGEEMSFFIVSDGKTIKNFGTAQDHKRALEGDLGKNTGGMGAYSPSRLITEELEQKILNRIVIPTLRGLENLGATYEGFLYVGLMIIDNEPYLIEYNVRMGDPECQTILPMLSTDLFDVLMSCCDGTLNKTQINWHNKKSLCVVLCSKGYPDEFEKNVPIKNIDKINLKRDEYCYHASTKIIKDEVCAIGGRVLSFVCLSDNFKISRNNIFQTINLLKWDKGFFRKDIGYKAINE